MVQSYNHYRLVLYDCSHTSGMTIVACVFRYILDKNSKFVKIRKNE